MQRVRIQTWLVLIGLLVAFPATARAGDYKSGFGIAISVPDTYLVLTRDEVRKNSALFQGADEDSRFSQIPAAMRNEVYKRVDAGLLEIFYRTEDVEASFVDNVNLMKQSAELPRNQAQLAEVCSLLPGEFSRMFGRPVGLDGCELRSVARRPALFLAFDGAIEGTKTLQYQVQTRPGETLILTATASKSTIARMMSEFESMVASIRVRAVR